MAWVSGTAKFEKPLGDETHFEGNIFLTKVNDIIFHGAIRESDEKTPVSGALVNVYAQVNHGPEKLLGYAYSADDGYYLLNIERKKMPAGTTAIIIRAGTGVY